VGRHWLPWYRNKIWKLMVSCHPYPSKYLLCSAEERHAYRFGTTWGWVNDDFFIVRWPISLIKLHFWVKYPFNSCDSKAKFSAAITPVFSLPSEIIHSSMMKMVVCNILWKQWGFVFQDYLMNGKFKRIAFILSKNLLWQVTWSIQCILAEQKH